MLPVQIFLAILVLCLGYAALRGGAPERIGAAIFTMAYILSTIAASGPTRYEWVEVGVFAVDVAVLLALLALALRANRFWTLWVAALQIIGTAGHAVKLADPELMRSGYAIALAL